MTCIDDVHVCYSKQTIPDTGSVFRIRSTRATLFAARKSNTESLYGRLNHPLGIDMIYSDSAH